MCALRHGGATPGKCKVLARAGRVRNLLQFTQEHTGGILWALLLISVCGGFGSLPKSPRRGEKNLLDEPSAYFSTVVTMPAEGRGDTQGKQRRALSPIPSCAGSSKDGGGRGCPGTRLTPRDPNTRERGQQPSYPLAQRGDSAPAPEPCPRPHGKGEKHRGACSAPEQPAVRGDPRPSSAAAPAGPRFGGWLQQRGAQQRSPRPLQPAQGHRRALHAQLRGRGRIPPQPGEARPPPPDLSALFKHCSSSKELFLPC